MTEKITAADAIRLLDTGKAVAVDVREPDEYAVGRPSGQNPGNTILTTVPCPLPAGCIALEDK